MLGALCSQIKAQIMGWFCVCVCAYVCMCGRVGFLLCFSVLISQETCRAGGVDLGVRWSPGALSTPHVLLSIVDTSWSRAPSQVVPFSAHPFPGFSTAEHTTATLPVEASLCHSSVLTCICFVWPCCYSWLLSHCPVADGLG